MKYIVTIKNKYGFKHYEFDDLKSAKRFVFHIEDITPENAWIHLMQSYLIKEVVVHESKMETRN